MADFVRCKDCKRLFTVDDGDALPAHECKAQQQTKPKNLYAKTRPVTNPYEVWESSDGWRWLVLKKWQVHDDAPYARWFCFVTSPYCRDGEYGDCYVTDVTRNAHCVQVEQAGLLSEVAS